jgi:hypothetical protein
MLGKTGQLAISLKGKSVMVLVHRNNAWEKFMMSLSLNVSTDIECTLAEIVHSKLYGFVIIFFEKSFDVSNFYTNQTNFPLLKKITWPHSASELYRLSDRLLSAQLVPTFADRGCHVVSVTDPYGRILGFLDLSHYFFFQVAPQL